MSSRFIAIYSIFNADNFPTSIQNLHGIVGVDFLKTGLGVRGSTEFNKKTSSNNKGDMKNN